MICNTEEYMKNAMRKYIITGVLVLLLACVPSLDGLAKESAVLRQDFVSKDEMAKLAAAGAELWLFDEAGCVKWHFPEVTKSINFITETIITRNKLGEIYVEFIQEGELPGPGEVTIFLNSDINPFKEGDEVRLYYINPVTQLNEFVETGVVENNSLTFAMEHCSLYLITTTDYGESYVPDVDGISKRVVIVGALVAAAGISILHRWKKAKKEKEPEITEE